MINDNALIACLERLYSRKQIPEGVCIMKPKQPYQRSLSRLPVIILMLITFAYAYPPAFDWRNNNGNLVTPVKNQGNCGSQWAFVAVALVEARIKIARAAIGGDTSNIDLSEQHLVSCNTATPNNGCSGGNVNIALQFMRTTGIVSEGCFPYIAANGNCANICANWQNSLVKVTGINTITEINKIDLVNRLKEAVSSIGPAGVYMDMYSSLSSYSGGVISSLSGTLLGGHCVVVVGYGNAGGSDYWICKNSWGTSWGEQGYFRIGINVSGFLTYNSFDVVTATDHDFVSIKSTVPDKVGNMTGWSPKGRLSYTVTSPTKVTVSLLSLQGRTLAVFVNGFKGSGTHEVVLPKSAVRPGSYVLLLNAGGQTYGRMFVVAE
jgi:C1A family cysteine protease